MERNIRDWRHLQQSRLDDPRPQVLGLVLDPCSADTRERFTEMSEAVDAAMQRDGDTVLAEEIIQADGTPTFRHLCTL